MSGDRGMDLHVHGGTGGIHANLDDMETTAVLIDDVSAGMLGLAVSLHGLLVGPDVLASAVLDPVGAAKFEATLLAALDGPAGLTATASRIGLRAVTLRTAAVAYRTADDVATAVTDTRRFLQGRALPLALPILSVTSAGWLAGQAIAGRGPGADFQRLITDHPGIVDEMVGSAPGFITVMSLALCPPTASLNSRRTPFPTTIAEGAALLSLLYPDGEAHLRALGLDLGSPFMTRAPRGFGDLIGGLSYRNNQPKGQIDVRAVERTLPDGSVQRSYIVDIPGTKTWTLPGDHTAINDTGTNLHALSGGSTAYEQGIAEALRRAGAQPGDPVMLVGHSQGGLVAVNAAQHFTTSGQYNVTHVVTAGSPVANLHVPDSVKVLSLENEHDIIPHLDGRANPDEPNHTTVTFDRQSGEIGTNHNIDASYLPAALALDQSTEPSVQDFRDSAEPFFTGDRLISQAYEITRVAS